MNDQLKSRLKSLAWRTAAVMVVAGLDIVVQNLSSFELPGYVVVFIGLIVGEITKHLNNYCSQKR